MISTGHIISMPGLESAIFSARLPSGAWAGKWRSQVQLGNENRPYDTSQEPGLPIRATHRVAPTGTGRGEGGHIGPPPPAQAKACGYQKDHWRADTWVLAYGWERRAVPRRSGRWRLIANG